jgi:hypothetical protein
MDAIDWGGGLACLAEAGCSAVVWSCCLVVVVVVVAVSVASCLSPLCEQPTAREPNCQLRQLPPAATRATVRNLEKDF